MAATVGRNLKDELNRMNPAAAHVKLGDVLYELITKHNAAMAKLDADAGATDTNYTTLYRVAPLAER